MLFNKTVKERQRSGKHCLIFQLVLKRNLEHGRRAILVDEVRELIQSDYIVGDILMIYGKQAYK
jgi:hypothetical protein